MTTRRTQTNVTFAHDVDTDIRLPRSQRKTVQGVKDISRKCAKLNQYKTRKSKN